MWSQSMFHCTDMKYTLTAGQSHSARLQWGNQSFSKLILLDIDLYLEHTGLSNVREGELGENAFLDIVVLLSPPNSFHNAKKLQYDCQRHPMSRLFDQGSLSMDLPDEILIFVEFRSFWHHSNKLWLLDQTEAHQDLNCKANHCDKELSTQTGGWSEFLRVFHVKNVAFQHDEKKNNFQPIFANPSNEDTHGASLMQWTWSKS